MGGAGLKEAREVFPGDADREIAAAIAVVIGDRERPAEALGLPAGAGNAGGVLVHPLAAGSQAEQRIAEPHRDRARLGGCADVGFAVAEREIGGAIAVEVAAGERPQAPGVVVHAGDFRGTEEVEAGLVARETGGHGRDRGQRDGQCDREQREAAIPRRCRASVADDVAGSASRVCVSVHGRHGLLPRSGLQGARGRCGQRSMPSIGGDRSGRLPHYWG